LLKISSAFELLKCRFPLLDFSGDVQPSINHAQFPLRRSSISSCHAGGDRRASSSSNRAAVNAQEVVSPQRCRSLALDVALPIVAGLALGSHHRQAEYPSSDGTVRDSAGIGLRSYVAAKQDDRAPRKKITILYEA
jgi:hypothetical protein